MAKSKPRKPFKLTILGIVKWESKDWTVKEVALLLTTVMIFILLMLFILKINLVEIIGIHLGTSKTLPFLSKILKSRSP